MKHLTYLIVLACMPFISCAGCQKDQVAAAPSEMPHAQVDAIDMAKDKAEVDDAPIVQDNAIKLYAKDDRTKKERRFRIEDEQNTVDIFDNAGPGTVFVTQNQIVRDRYTMRATEVPSGSGSGFIWDTDGHIITNYHVIDGSSHLTVTLYNQKTYPAKLVGGEPKKDIAVLKIDAPADELTPIPRPDDTYELAVGQKAIAIGNPFGLDHTITTGIISAMGRDQLGYGGVTIRDMIQTDASINPGNSGGPLLDSSGQLIGMNTMIFSKSGASAGIGFAVPFSTIKRVVPQIIRTGKAQQIGLGISILPDAIARRNGIQGVIVRQVANNSPAARAGLRGVEQNYRGTYIGDVIVGIDDKKVTNYDTLYNALDTHQPGDTIQVKIRREGKIISLPVELYVLPD
ncbi:MAG: trypsin-like peptidase domain-containing protein [Bradymonadales bacterium]|nr:trypsin-like peptidase domain-containing protein [Bradymonadales bacterium]